jgi:hypothetical protein
LQALDEDGEKVGFNAKELNDAIKETTVNINELKDSKILDKIYPKDIKPNGSINLNHLPISTLLTLNSQNKISLAKPILSSLLSLQPLAQTYFKPLYNSKYVPISSLPSIPSMPDLSIPASILSTVCPYIYLSSQNHSSATPSIPIIPLSQLSVEDLLSTHAQGLVVLPSSVLSQLRHLYKQSQKGTLEAHVQKVKKKVESEGVKEKMVFNKDELM